MMRSTSRIVFIQAYVERAISEAWNVLVNGINDPKLGAFWLTHGTVPYLSSARERRSERQLDFTGPGGDSRDRG